MTFIVTGNGSAVQQQRLLKSVHVCIVFPLKNGVTMRQQGIQDKP